MKTFRDLLVWQKAHQLVLGTYQVTKPFPLEERYGLVQQMRRAAVSIAANIAEGHRRKSKQEFLKFLDIAHGSLDELKYYVLLAKDLSYLKPSQAQRVEDMAEEAGKMLNGFKHHIQQEVRHA
jgi:four helix bundle protein